jgi:hypothetical protein
LSFAQERGEWAATASLSVPISIVRPISIVARRTIRHAGSSSPSSRDDDMPDDDGAELTPLSPRPPPRDDDNDAGEEGV